MTMAVDPSRWRPVCRGVAFRLVALALVTSASAFQPALSRMQTLASCEGRSPNQVKETLRELGAKQLDRAGDEFEFRNEVLLTVLYDEESLAGLKVFLTSEYRDSKRPSRELSASHAQCGMCMSSSTYKELLSRLAQLKPLGSFRRTNPIGVVLQTAWVFKTDEYACADVIRQERNCHDAGSGCGIIDFKVFYRLPLNGRIEAKRLRTVGASPALEFSTYYIVVAGKEVQVSKSDYDRLSEGQIVQLQRTLLDNPVRILSVTAAKH